MNGRAHNKPDRKKRAKKRKNVWFMKRKGYDKQFKLAVVKMVREADKSVDETGEEPENSRRSLRRRKIRRI